MDPDDPHALDRLLEHQARVEAQIKRFLPVGFRDGHALCYPYEQDKPDTFVPSEAQLDELLTAYAALLVSIDPKPNNLTCWGFLACMEMMDFNELLIGYLCRAPQIKIRSELALHLVSLLDASIGNLQTANNGDSHDDDAGKRFYRLRDILRNSAGAASALSEQPYRDSAWKLRRLDDTDWKYVLRDTDIETLIVVLWYLKDRHLARTVFRGFNRRAAALVMDDLMCYSGKDPDLASEQERLAARGQLGKLLAILDQLIAEGQIEELVP